MCLSRQYLQKYWFGKSGGFLGLDDLCLFGCSVHGWIKLVMMQWRIFDDDGLEVGIAYLYDWN